MSLHFLPVQPSKRYFTTKTSKPRHLSLQTASKTAFFRKRALARVTPFKSKQFLYRLNQEAKQEATAVSLYLRKHLKFELKLFKIDLYMKKNYLSSTDSIEPVSRRKPLSANRYPLKQANHNHSVAQIDITSLAQKSSKETRSSILINRPHFHSGSTVALNENNMLIVSPRLS